MSNTMISFGKNIMGGQVILDEGHEDQLDVVEYPCGCRVETTYQNVFSSYSMTIVMSLSQRIVYCPVHQLGETIVHTVKLTDDHF